MANQFPMEAPMPATVHDSKRALKAVKVDAGCDRFGTAIQLFDWRFDCKISGKDTAGDCCVFDTIRTAKGGPPLHVHHDQDEWFYVREGEFLFQVGHERFHLKPGDSLFGPRMVAHAFTSLTDRSALIVAFQPAGGMEQLFSEVSRLSRARGPTLDDWKTLSRAHNVDIVGPPLPIG
jgi:mannose-6-phosphate isomerase-like protein (cupin superfamily)